MPLNEKGQKIMASMKRQYGPAKAKRVFYGARNKGAITKVDPESKAPKRSLKHTRLPKKKG